MIWILFALMGLVFFGLKNFFEKVTVKDLEPETTAVVIRSVAFVQILCFFIAYIVLTDPTISLGFGLVYAFLAGMSMAGGTLATYRALKVQKLTLVVPVINLGGVVASILGIVFLGEIANLYWAIGFLIAIGALLLIGWRRGGDISFTPFIAMLGFGLMSFFNKMALSFFSPFEAFFFVFLFAMGFYLLIWRLKKKPSMEIKDRKSLIKGGLAGTSLALGTVFFFTALNIGQLSRVVMIVDMNVAFTVALGVLVLDEEVSKRKWVGIVLSVAAILLLSLS